MFCDLTVSQTREEVEFNDGSLRISKHAKRIMQSPRIQVRGHAIERRRFLSDDGGQLGKPPTSTQFVERAIPANETKPRREWPTVIGRRSRPKPEEYGLSDVL